MRILAIWDFRTVPYSIGDLIHLIERMQIMMTMHKIDKFDFCIVCDPNNPARKPGHQNITPENYHYQFSLLLSVIYSSPYVGNYFIFDSHKKLEKYIEDNKSEYILWPNYENYLNKKHSYTHNFNYIQSFYKKNKYIPMFKLRENTIKEIYKFYLRKVFPKYPVVIQLRNSNRGVVRNSKLEEWLKFFKYYEEINDIKFIIIGRQNETGNMFRGLSNVLISKDYCNSVEYDMGFAYTSLFFLSSISGIASLMFFTETPYVVFGFRPAHEKVIKNKNFNFARKYQKLIWQKETSNMIIKEFEFLYKNINKNAWRDKMRSYVGLDSVCARQ
jgi:hypothetical protein